MRLSEAPPARVATPARPLPSALKPPAPDPRGKEKATGPTGARYMVLSGDAPAPAPRGGGKNKHAEAYMAASKLKPGEWFHWKDAPKVFKATVKKWAQALGRKDIYAYKTTAGTVIVRREPAAAAPADND